MITIYYLIVCIIALASMLIYLVQNTKVDSKYVMLSILININCCGRFLLATSTSLDMALFSNTLLYIGSLYAQVVLFIIIEKLCNLKVSKIVKICMFLYSSVIMILVITVKYNDLYYKSVELVKGNGYNYLKKIYGPCHILNPIWVVFISILLLGCVIYAYKNNANISYKLMRTGSILIIIPFFAYILEKIFRPNVSFVVVGYLCVVVVMNRIFERKNLYDITTNIVYSIERMKEYGYIIFDKKNRYVGANTYIKELFPEINNWQIDLEVSPTDSYVYKEVVGYLLKYQEDENDTKTIEVNELYLELQCRELFDRNKKCVGHILEFVDRTAEKKYINAMKDYSIMLEDEVTEKTEDIMYVKDMLVLGMADLLENRDSSTGGHIKRTSDVVKIFSKRLIEFSDTFEITQLFLDRVVKAAPMHDIGKIAIDDTVLRKKGRYNDSEYEKMKKHTTEGARIIEQIMKNVEDDRIYEIIRNVACYHHEKWNGSGYPEGLSGKNIPLEARIMALADVFDALVSKRCYKEALSYKEAFKIIESSLGEHFDPELGKIFLECREDLEMLYDNY